MDYTALVTLNEVKKKGLTNQNVDERLLAVALLRSQDIDLSDVIGKSFMRDLQVKKSANTLTANERNLIDDYILPYLAICVDIRAIEATSNRIMNAGTGKVNATEFTNNQQDDNRVFRNSLKWDRDVLKTDLIKFIGENRTGFPLYKSFGCEGGNSGNSSLLNNIITI
jgi:hypothetical protein